MEIANKERALVLGGGGVTGIAWEIGVIAGLARSGIDIVAAADVLIGTSAGATVAAQISSSLSLGALFRRQIDGSAAPEPIIDLDVRELITRFAEIMSAEPDGERARAKIGALALAQDRVPEEERRHIIENRLPCHDWPEWGPELWLTAADAQTGKLQVFDRNSGVSLVDAVAASCAIPVVWPAVSINGSRYIDGSFRSATNMDLAHDFARILVLQPMDLGATVDVPKLNEEHPCYKIQPDLTASAAMSQFLDPAAAAKSASEGYRQGQESAASLGSFWL